MCAMKSATDPSAAPRPEARTTLVRLRNELQLAEHVNAKRKEVNTMKYEKPELTPAGTAEAVVKSVSKNGSPYDNPITHTLTAPAYEADE